MARSKPNFTYGSNGIRAGRRVNRYYHLIQKATVDAATPGEQLTRAMREAEHLKEAEAHNTDEIRAAYRKFIKEITA